MELRCCVDIPEKLLKDAGAILSERPDLVTTLYDGSLKISVPKPDAWKLTMNRFADRISARFSERSGLFELSEESNGVSGGYMGSCMPTAATSAFLRAWIAHARHRPAIPVQMPLFLETA